MVIRIVNEIIKIDEEKVEEQEGNPCSLNKFNEFLEKNNLFDIGY